MLQWQCFMSQQHALGSIAFLHQLGKNLAGKQAVLPSDVRAVAAQCMLLPGSKHEWACTVHGVDSRAAGSRMLSGLEIDEISTALLARLLQSAMLCLKPCVSGRAWGGCSGAAGGEMGLERPKREELPALQDPEGSQLLTVRSVPLLLSQLLSPAWPLPAAMYHGDISTTHLCSCCHPSCLA